jgi:cytochrome b6-f complex iron-sulfur subunit
MRRYPADAEVDMRFTRRSLIVGGAALAGASGIATILNFAYPRHARKPGDEYQFVVDQRLIPASGGEPYLDDHGKFALVNLLPGEGAEDFAGSAAGGGLLALSRACTHLRCTLPWNEAYTFYSPYRAEPQTGWFRCACHGSTYTKAGVRVFGPAPRSVDTLAIRIRDDGSIVVDTGDVTEGALDNPLRATRYDVRS